MSPEEELAHLRQLFSSAPESTPTRILAISLSLIILLVILWLVRKRKLREEYTPIWVVVALGTMLLSLQIDLLRKLTLLIGAWSLSSTIFFLGEVFLVAICLNYAVRLSRFSVQIKNLAQQHALLEARLRRLEPQDESPQSK